MNVENFSATDDELVSASLTGGDAAFASLIERYQEVAAKIMWRFTRDPATHEELTHEAFVQCYLSLRNYRGEAPFAHYFSALASKVGYQFWRKRGSDKTCALPDNYVDKRVVSPEHHALVADAPKIFDLLSELNPEERLVLTLTYYEEKNAKEIAAMLNWTHVATRMRISRARRKLQQIAKRRGLTWEE